MLETRYLGLLRNAATVVTGTLLLSGCLLQEELAEEQASAEAAIEAEFELSATARVAKRRRNTERISERRIGRLQHHG